MADTREPGPIPLSIEPELESRVNLALVRAEPVEVAEASPPLDGEMADLAARLLDRHRGRTPAEIPGLQPARDLYRAFGIDPTRTRPSSVALLRRVLLGKPLPRILNAVDVCNLCSLRFLLPLGLYDAAKIRGPVVLRRGRPGESFRGIRKDDVHLDGRPALADDEGAFGNPTSDSLRTSVTTSTRSLWMVIFAPHGYAPGLLEEHARFGADAMVRHLAPRDGAVSTSSDLMGCPRRGSA